MISNKIKEFVFQKLVNENSKLENTKHIVFKDLKLRKYLDENQNTALSKIIFSVRSKTLDLKTLQPWKYFDNLCVLCEMKAETMSHFLSCKTYENVAPIINWEKMFENKPDEQFKIAKNIRKRLKQRNARIENYEAGHLHNIADPMAPGDCQAV